MHADTEVDASLSVSRRGNLRCVPWEGGVRYLRVLSLLLSHSLRCNLLNILKIHTLGFQKRLKEKQQCIFLGLRLIFPTALGPI